jgi:hypothetical protein
MSAAAEQKPRHYCRHCRGKLKAPVANHREALCVKGCHSSFYRHRCIVCERAMPRNAGNQRTCYRADCKDTWRLRLIDSHFLGMGSANGKLIAEVPIKACTKTGDKGGRWVQIAGPPLTPGQFHCATVPDGPCCQWKDGRFERIEAENQRLLKQHFAKQAAECLIQPHHMPANIQGGYQPKYRLLKHRDLPDPIIPGRRYGRVEKAQPPTIQLPDDLSISAFLRREAVRQ